MAVLARVLHKVRIGEGHPAEARHGCVAACHHARRQVRGELAQVGKRAAQHGDVYRVLNLAHALHDTVYALQGMLVGDIVAVIVGAVHMGVLVGVAHGDVDQRDMEFRLQLPDQPDGLGHVGLQAALPDAEAVGVGEAVIGVEPAGQEELAGGQARLGCPVAILQEAGAVLEAAAVFARPGVGAEQLAGQIPVAALHVHAVEARLLAQPRSFRVGLLKAAQIVVGDDAVGGQGGVLQGRAVVGDHGFRVAVGLGIAAAVGGLHHQHGGVAVLPQAGLADVVREALEFVHVLLGEVQLMGAGTAFRHGGHGLEPDQPRARLGEALITTDGQFARRAALGAVGALHGLEGDAVGGGFRAQGQGAEQRGNVLLQGQISLDLRRGGAQAVQGGIMEGFMKHQASTSLRSCKNYDKV